MSITARNILDQIETLRARGEEFCVATVVRTADATSAKAGAKAVVSRDGTISGFIGGGCVQGSVRKAAKDVMSSGTARLIRVKPSGDVTHRTDHDGTELHASACPSGGTVELFIEPMLLAPRIVILGASPVGAALVSLAVAMGYRTLVVCSDEAQAQIPQSHQYSAGLDEEGSGAHAADALIVATQGRGDLAALANAVRSASQYIAFVGSRRKGEVLKGQLAQQGVDPARLDVIKCPAGINIGAIEPEEIAVSIIAEVIRWRRDRFHNDTAG